MRRLLLLASFVSLSVSAQDVIVKKDGSTIISKVIKIGTQEVEYKKASNPEGPTYSLLKSEIMAINYENGEKDTFDSSDFTSTATEKDNDRTPEQRYIEKKPADNNSELIAKYRSEIRFGGKTSKRNAQWFFPIMTVSDSSVISNDDIEMQFVPALVLNYNFGYKLYNYIEIKNKTDKTLYIDKANTYKIFKDYTYESYYDSNQVTISNGNTSGASVGLGGIASVLGVGGILGTLASSVAVGGASHSSVSTTYSQERIMIIPPHGKVHLTEFTQQYAGKYYKVLDVPEDWSFSISGISKGWLKSYEHKFYNENDTPYSVKYIITYSQSPNFDTYSALSAKVYARCLIGGYTWDGVDHLRVISWGKSPWKVNKAIKQIQEVVSNFWDDQGILVGGYCSANY